MKNLRFLIVLAAIPSALLACKNSIEEEGSIAGDHGQTRAITLMEGDSITVDFADDGNVEITVIVAPGRPNAGTYRSNDGNLVEYAQDGQKALGKSGRKVWIRVAADNTITSIGWSQKT